MSWCLVLVLVRVASGEALDIAYESVRRQGQEHPTNADVRSSCRCWLSNKEKLKDELQSVSHRFSLLTRVTLKNGEDAGRWSARSALVLRAVAIVPVQRLPVSPSLHPSKGARRRKICRGPGPRLSPEHRHFRSDARSDEIRHCNIGDAQARESSKQDVYRQHRPASTFSATTFLPAGLAVAKTTDANFIAKASRLYEQERNAPSAESLVASPGDAQSHFPSVPVVLRVPTNRAAVAVSVVYG
jgi:hypothetical protein